MGDVLIPGASIHLLASAGLDEGRGHSARILALAEAFVARGSNPSVELRRGALTPGQAERLTGLGLRLGSAPGGSVVVADLPDPDASREHPADRLVVFDDGGAFAGDAAIVIQPSLPTWTRSGTARVGSVLAGYAYVPIASAFLRGRPPVGARGSERTLVVCFGGSDPLNVTARLAPALLALPGCRTVVVVGADHRGTLPDPTVEVLRDPPGFVDLLASADLVVASAGTMKFELAVLGRPMVLVAAAADQLDIGRVFAATGAARYLGDGRTVDPHAVRDAALELLGDEVARSALARRAQELIDGHGAERIADAVLGLANRVG